MIFWSKLLRIFALVPLPLRSANFFGARKKRGYFQFIGNIKFSGI
ncbi:hypothetical protein SELSPUOL_00689 [Selenomonas sputigena ATCC 35185]|uniref:Uncharacterized protein n=1 Tax=Selenomonas sputigena (strain ATCC 35185 / DSM 20758 / CCUG 44933 / VPI D19B-28) TaxID=546271 RepID=C9LTA7_SELS3|nr:hypothetical protein SELSPUOL_00689 [Selenomonas sputigena ATCC 35185]